MKEIFDIRRFGKYLLTDVKMGISSYGITLLSLSLAGLAVSVISLLFNLITSGYYSPVQLEHREALFILCGGLASIIIPVNYYGRLTDKRKGAEFLLTPASTFEKYLSMILISLLVIPFTYIIIYLATDSLWCAVDGSTSLFSVLAHNPAIYLLSLNAESGFDTGFLIWDDLANIILTFLLGGLWFKKSKLAKTFLTLMGLGIAVAMVFGIFANADIVMDILEFVFSKLEIIDTVSDLSLLAILLTVTYFRVRKIQL